MKRIFIIIAVMFIFTFSVNAEETDSIYNELYTDSNIAQLEDSIDESTKEILKKLGIALSDYESFFSGDTDSYIEVVLDFFKSGIKKPLAAMTLGIGVLIICSSFGGLWSAKLPLTDTYNYICALSLIAIVLLPMMNTASACISAVKSVGGFMLAFVPIFSGLIILSGGAATGVVYQTFMLGICELITSGMSFLVAPLISAYICIGVTSAVSGVEGAQLLALRIKSVANWLIGLIMTFFTGFLSVQSIVTKAADTVTIKTARFFVGSFIPVVGGALGDALTTVTAGVSLLKSTAMAWCIIVLLVMLLPSVIELLIWRIVMFVLSSVAVTFNIGDSARLFDTLSAALGLLIAIMLSVAVLFILSLVIIKVGAG